MYRMLQKPINTKSTQNLTPTPTNSLKKEDRKMRQKEIRKRISWYRTIWNEIDKPKQNG